MSLFQRQPKRVLPVRILQTLPEFGRTSLGARAGGRPVTDQRFGWDQLMGPVSRELFGEHRDQAIGELYEAAIDCPEREMATFGAYLLIAEFIPELEDRRFLSLFDDSLELMRTEGLSSLHLNRYEADRWVAVHGDLQSSFDGLFPVDVPDDAALPTPRPLPVGASRMLALTEPLPRGNAFLAERQADALYVIYSERPHSVENPTRERCEEEHLGTFTSLEDLLRALGAMLGSPPHWSDNELTPYFPLRRA